MIYRIAIYRYENEERKFDHYATSEELKCLRVNADGKVEMADVDPYTPHEFYGWLDASSTHEVEWGFVWHDGKSSFMNMILSQETTETQSQ